MNKPTVAKLAEIIEKRYPKTLALEWDGVGLTTNNSQIEVTKILLTIDVTPEVVSQAKTESAQLLISHHPLILDEEESSDIQEKRIELKMLLEENNIALYCIHTNADIAEGGVNDAFAAKLGLIKVTRFGQEQMGRIGELKENMNLETFVNSLKHNLPKTKGAIQVSGNLESEISKVAVCGGSGSSLLAEVRQTDADVFVTADLKHHAISDNKVMNGPALILISHWASEWLWLPELKKQLESDFSQSSFDVNILISEIVTDSWDFSVATKS
ncbi:MAG: Nif3-like dinuclear metal center hexameric protein [Actinomycetota bacterium]|nr:Nif3-like dinuclear metal center hexameric protein [Actinomycetota bacterium]